MTADSSSVSSTPLLSIAGEFDEAARQEKRKKRKREKEKRRERERAAASSAQHSASTVVDMKELFGEDSDEKVRRGFEK